MTLLFDVGNTNIYVGLGNNNEIVDTFRLTTELNKSPDEYYLIIKNFINHSKITGVIIGSVVPQVTISLIKLVEKYFGVKPVILAPGVKTGIKVIADNPREVGSDLIAVAAGVDGDEPTLIIDLGTANKFIYLKNKTIKGVIIAPGISLSIKALNLNTALLPEVEIKFPDKYLGNNTIHCIQT
ncbi:MAG: type III pantothenate kinase, partial [Acholeplasmataceae bacterium]